MEWLKSKNIGVQRAALAFPARPWIELALTVVVWAAVLAAVAFFNVWNYFLWIYFAPALTAANR